MVDANTLSKFKQVVETSRRILLSVHRNPDGDAVGSLLGMRALLLSLNKEPVAYCPDGIPRSFAFLPGANQIARTLEGSFDATILLDTPERALFADGFEVQGTLIVIDHHMTAEEFGDVIIREPSSAVGETLYYLADRSGWPVDDKAALCFYTSIVSDTSSFRYESATAASHKAAAALMELGADPAVVGLNLFESFPLTRQRLLAEVLKTLEIGAAGKYAVMFCTKDMMERIGASPDDLDGVINTARGIENVELAALLREEENGSIRGNLRSKGNVNAKDVAARFGGGGHVNAAGFRLASCTIQGALEQLLTVAEEILHASHRHSSQKH